MHTYNALSVADGLPYILDEILGRGTMRDSRSGRVQELSNVVVSLHEPWHRFVLLKDRKASPAAQIAETMWVLSGRNDIKWLSRYLPRASEFSDDGSHWRAGYGPRLRGFGDRVDQLRYVVFKLVDPTTRQAVISLWDPETDTKPGSKDYPCNDWLDFKIRDGKLNLNVAARSNDVIWGWSGINQFEWSALQEIVAGILGVQIGELNFFISSLHLYERHFGKAAKIVDLTAQDPLFTGSDEPQFVAQGDTPASRWANFQELLNRWFELEWDIWYLPKQESDSAAAQDLRRRIAELSDPMLRSWLGVIWRYWHGRNPAVAYPPTTCDQEVAMSLSADDYDLGKLPVRQKDEKIFQHHGQSPEKMVALLQFLDRLHRTKSRCYGDSWKARGEVFSIWPNILRKVDRLGSQGDQTESAFDTAGDLVIYLAKYIVWLTDSRCASEEDAVLHELQMLAQARFAAEVEESVLVEEIRDDTDYVVENLEHMNANRKIIILRAIISRAWDLAVTRWGKLPPAAKRQFTYEEQEQEPESDD